MRKVTDKQKANLKPFKKNNPVTGEKDERINRNGRAKSFDQLRTLFQEIANEEINGETRIRKIGEMMAKDKKLFKEFLEFAYGKVPLSQIIKVDESNEISWSDFINGYGKDPDTKASNNKS